MKNRFLWLLILGMALFASCSDDDDKDPFKNYSADYSADKLDLKLNGMDITGASVAFNSINKENASVTLKGLIPGESALEIKNLVVTELSGDDYSFIGENKNDDRTVSVEGAVKSGVLSLKTGFKVTSKVVGEWQLAPVETDDSGAPLSSGLYMNVIPEADTSTIMGLPVSMFIPMVSNIGGQILPMLLKKVEFKDNGTLIATYLENMDEMGSGEGNFVQSSEELVRYNVKDVQIYLSINIALLIPDMASLLIGRSEMGLEEMMNMVVNGIPLKLDINEGGIRAYVDQQMMLPFMNPIRELLIPMMQGNEDMKELVPLVYDVIRLVEKSKTIELGLDLVPYVEAEQPQASMALPRTIKETVHVLQLK